MTIATLFGKADLYLLEKHEQLANLINEYVGISNYRISQYMGFLPPLILAASGIYDNPTANLGLFSSAYSLIFTAWNYAENRKLEQIEEERIGNKSYSISLYRSEDNIKKNYREIRFFLSVLFPGMVASVFLQHNILFNPLDISITLAFFPAGSAAYLSSINHIPQKKGKVQQSLESLVENATNLIKRPSPSPVFSSSTQKYSV